MEQRNRYKYPATFSEQPRWVGLPRDEFIIYVPWRIQLLSATLSRMS